MLNELLTPRMGLITRARHPTGTELHKGARNIFGAHRKDNPPDKGHHLWEHAEEFLQCLDLARKDPGLAKVVFGDGGDIDATWKRAVNAVAEECSFAKHANIDLEAWVPFKQWAASLRDEHTIITFNYDMVAERLGLRAVLPSEESKGRDVLELHGSVDWYLVGDKVQRDRSGVEIPMIATPGPRSSPPRTKGAPFGVCDRLVHNARPHAPRHLRPPPERSETPARDPTRHLTIPVARRSAPTLIGSSER